LPAQHDFSADQRPIGKTRNVVLGRPRRVYDRLLAEVPPDRPRATLHNILVGIDVVRIDIGYFEPTVAKHILHLRPPIIALLRFPQIEQRVRQSLDHRPPIQDLMSEFLED